MDDNAKVAALTPEHIPSEFENDLRTLINKRNRESLSDTPDYILARFMNSCLMAYSVAVGQRDHWFGVNMWDKLDER